MENFRKLREDEEAKRTMKQEKLEEAGAEAEEVGRSALFFFFLPGSCLVSEVLGFVLRIAAPFVLVLFFASRIGSPDIIVDAFPVGKSVHAIVTAGDQALNAGRPAIGVRWSASHCRVG